MVSIEAFSELLEVLYSAPLDQEQWQRFLTLVCQHTQGKTGYFLCADSRLGLSVRALGGTPHDAKFAVDYNQQYASSDPYHGALIRNGRTGVFQGNDVFPDESLLQTALYRVMLAPMGIRHVTLIPLTLSVRRFEAMSIWRTSIDGPMDEDCNRMLNLLVPHIQKALHIRQILGITQQRLAGAEAMADASSTAAFLLTSKGRVVHANVAAESLLRHGGALALQNKLLIAISSCSRDALCSLISKSSAASFASPGAPPAHAISLPRSGSRPPLQLLATPLSETHRNRSRADILLLATDPEKASCFPDNVLRELYGLTSAETEVANGLLMGYSLGDIASLRHVALGTARIQMKSLLGKTGTDRQSELMRLLMTLPKPLAAA